MPSPNERHRNNVKAGIFFLVAVALAVTTIILLTDTITKLSRPTTDYHVTFRVEDGIKNLKRGADVRIGGVSLGTVTNVVPRFDPNEPFTTIDVTLSIDEHVRLYEGAHVVITPAILGADAWIDIIDVGEGTPIDPSSSISGASKPGLLSALLGPEGATKAADIMSDVKATTGDARAVVGQLRSDYESRWSGKVDEIFDKASVSIDDFQGAMAEAKGLFADGRTMVSDNRPQIDTIVDNTERLTGDGAEVMTHFREETVAKIDGFLDRGREGLETVISIVDDVSADYDTWAPEVREMLANLRLGAQQIKLATIEVRRSPWKLLYRPSDQELDHELLYDATRSFALATADMKAASETAQRLIENHRDDLAADPRLQQLLAEILQRPLNNYEAAEQRLLNVLSAQP